MTWVNSVNDTPILQFCGVDLTNKYRLALEICDQLDYNLTVLSASRLPTDPQALFQLKKRWERQALLTHSILLLDCDDLPESNSFQTLNISYFLESVLTPVIISCRARLQTKHRSLINFDIPQISYHEQLALWENHLSTFSPQLNGHIPKLSSQFNLSPSLIISACNSLKNNPEEIQLDTPEEHPKIYHYLWNFCRVQARPRLENLAQRIESNASWH